MDLHFRVQVAPRDVHSKVQVHRVLLCTVSAVKCSKTLPKTLHSSTRWTCTFECKSPHATCTQKCKSTRCCSAVLNVIMSESEGTDVWAWGGRGRHLGREEPRLAEREGLAVAVVGALPRLGSEDPSGQAPLRAGPETPLHPVDLASPCVF